jgi:hypothetical protein
MWVLTKRAAVVLGTTRNGAAFCSEAAGALFYASRWVLIVVLLAISFADLLKPLVLRWQEDDKFFNYQKDTNPAEAFSSVFKNGHPELGA